ncbi:fibroin heavy chain-like isoform X3 [Aricia agestis]|uniref:fibroin heavy chain-like isoform X3 n=1 Tax=Aricia agestis TaxID=91739 RepID=UPI001C20C08F|nr:fibroin heavy chain-like isoform X3 [Aricia agestis]
MRVINMKPLVVVAFALILSVGALPENIEDVKELPQAKDIEVEAEESAPQTRAERCTDCTINYDANGEPLAAFKALPGAVVHTQEIVEECTPANGCAGVKIKDGRIVQRFENVNAFNAASAADLANEFQFLSAELAASGNVPYWWMNKDSPFKAGGGGGFEKFTSSSFTSSNLGGAGLAGAGLGGAALGGAGLGSGALGGAGLGSGALGGAGLGSSALGVAGLGSSALGGAGLGSGAIGGAGLGNAALGGAALGGSGLGVSGLGSSAYGVGLSSSNLGAASLGGAGIGSSGIAGGIGGTRLGGAGVAGAGLGNAAVGTTALGGSRLGGASVGGAGLGVNAVGLGYGASSGYAGAAGYNGAGYSAQSAGSSLNLGGNPFLNGGVSKFAGATNLGVAATRPTSFQSTYEASRVNLAKNPFPSGANIGQAQGGYNAYGTNTQNFASTAVSKFSGLAGSAATAGSNVNLIQNQQKLNEFDFTQQQQQQNIGVGLGLGIGGGAVGSGDLQQTCSGDGYACVIKSQCINGVVSGAGLLQASTKKQYCNLRTEVCCRIQVAVNPGYGDTFGAGSDINGIYRPNLKPGLPYLPPDNTNSGSNFVSSTVVPRPIISTPRPFTTAGPTYLPPISSTSAPGYLPPVGEQSINRETIVPKPNYIDGSLILDETRPPRPKPTIGPVISEIPAGCAAALKCTPIEFCTADGVISNTSVVLSREQNEYRVPLTDCKDIATGRIGKCCRDPYYTDPWPVNQLGKWVPGVFGGNDGKYVPDNRGSGSGVPPVTTRPFVSGSTILNEFIKPTTPVYQGSKGGRGQYTKGGKGQYGQNGQGSVLTPGPFVKGPGAGIRPGQGIGTGGRGQVVSQGVGTGVSQGFGQGVVSGGGSIYRPGQGVAQGSGQGVIQGTGLGISQGSGLGVSQGSGIVQGSGLGVSQGSGLGISQGTGFGVSQGSGVAQGSGLGVSQGSGFGVSQGFGQGAINGGGSVIREGQGVILGSGLGTSQGTGFGVSQGSGIAQGSGLGVSQGSGLGVTQGFGQGVINGEGSVIREGQGVIQGSGLGISQGTGFGVSQGSGISQGSGLGLSQGSGLGVSQGSGLGVSQGSGLGISQGLGTSQGSGLGISQGSGLGISQGFGQGIGGEGQGLLQGTGTGVSQGFGQGVLTGTGQGVIQGGGSLISQGEGVGVTQGLGVQGQGFGVSQGFGQGVSQGEGSLISQGAGIGIIPGQGEALGFGQGVLQGQGQGISQGFGQAVSQGNGAYLSGGSGSIIRQGQGQGFSQGFGTGIRQSQGYTLGESESRIHRVTLKPYYASQQCGSLNGQRPFGNHNDLEVDFAEIPWQAMVLEKTNKSLLCGGVITRPDVVITAAACVDGLDAQNVLIKGGEWKLGVDEEPLPFQIVQVKNILVHPFYKRGTYHFDVAILVLSENLRFANNIYPICLPSAQDDFEALDSFLGSSNGVGECIVTGWGKEILQAHTLGSIMHSLNVSLIAPTECQAKLSQDYPHLLEYYDRESCVCGQPTNPLNNICSVDIGSALACTNGNGHYTLRGIYSWDSGCRQIGNQIGSFYKFDVEWYEWALGLIESVRFTQYTSGAVVTGGRGQVKVNGQGLVKQTGGGLLQGTGFGPINTITYSEKITKTEPKVYTYTTKPEYVTYTTKPEYVTYTTKPEIVTYTTKPEIVTFTTKPEYFTYTTKPKVFTYTTKPEVFTFTTKPQLIKYQSKPQFIAYETSGSGTDPQYVAPGRSFKPNFSDLIKHTHSSTCQCEGK